MEWQGQFPPGPATYLPPLPASPPRTLLSFSPSVCGMRVFSDWKPAFMLCMRRRSLLLAISLRILRSWSRCVSGVRGMLARLQGRPAGEKRGPWLDPGALEEDCQSPLRAARLGPQVGGRRDASHSQSPARPHFLEEGIPHSSEAPFETGIFMIAQVASAWFAALKTPSSQQRQKQPLEGNPAKPLLGPG